MNKLSMISVAFATSVLLVSAETETQQPQVTKEMMRGSPVMFNGERGEMRTQVGQGRGRMVDQGQVVQGQSVRQGEMPKMGMMIPATGDPAIDAELKVLTLEMETKIKAINEEYRKKIETLIGNRPLKGIMMNVTTGTERRMPMRLENNQNGTTTVRAGVVRGEMMEGDNNGQGRNSLTKEQRINAAKNAQPGNETGGLLMSFFGRFF